MSRREWAVIAAVFAVVGVTFVALFGEDVRGLFGVSTASLSSDGQRSAKADRKKTLKTFGTDSVRDTEESAAPKASSTREPGRAVPGHVVSTFGVDVDSASWSLVRRLVEQGSRVDPSLVRTEEFVNAFEVSYPQHGDDAVSVALDGVKLPLHSAKRLLRVGLQAARPERREALHVTLLVDVSGSMARSDRLPLARRALRMMLGGLRPEDSVGIVTFASGSQVLLPPTKASARETIEDAINWLEPGGGTAMGDGLEVAFRQALSQLSSRRQSRVVLLSDGAANIGPSTHGALLETISRQAKEGVTLTTIGFGLNGYRDHLMERLGDLGQGSHFYVGDERDARRVFVERISGTLTLAARDVKIQVTFDPAKVRSHRLLGYENRAMAAEAFRTDSDGGEMGPGQTVTAFYEVDLVDEREKEALGTVVVRWKSVRGGAIAERSAPIAGSALSRPLRETSKDFRFLASAALMAEKLRGSTTLGEWSWRELEMLATPAVDGREDREELLRTLRLLHLQHGTRAASRD